MTGVESINQKIIDDATNIANEIIEKAKAEVVQIAEMSNQEIKTKHEQMIETAEKNAETRAQRIIATSQLEGKKEYLATKQEIINDVFAKAVSSLASLGDAEYDALIKEMSNGIDGEIAHIPRDKEKGIGGGFIAKNGKIEYNFSFDALAKNAKERLEKDLVKILFG